MEYDEFIEKLRYLHRNPVKRGLCDKPEDCHWSSFRHYATGEQCSVEIESEWTVNRLLKNAPRPQARRRQMYELPEHTAICSILIPCIVCFSAAS